MRKHRSIPSLVLAAGLIAAATGAALGWGAIAVDDSMDTHPDDVGYGYSAGHNSEAAARSGAIRECKNSGNDSCKIALTYRTCGAYASSQRHYGVGEGSTESQARSAALQSCGSGCKIIVAECE